MILITFEAIPRHDSPEASEVGGAYVTCWIAANDMHEAELDARQHIHESGWIVGERTETSVIERADVEDDPDSLAYFDEARADGACFVFHTWPLGSDDDPDQEDTHPPA